MNLEIGNSGNSGWISNPPTGPETEIPESPPLGGFRISDVPSGRLVRDPPGGHDEGQDNVEEEKSSLLAARLFWADWKPAQRVWDVFQIVDPACVMGGGIQSPTILQCFSDRWLAMVHADPATQDELAEKLKVVACMGLLKMVMVIGEDDHPNHGDLGLFKAEICRFGGWPARAFLIAWTEGPADDGFDPACSRENSVPALFWRRQICELVAYTGDRIVARLSQDAVRLGISVAAVESDMPKPDP